MWVSDSNPVPERLLPACLTVTPDTSHSRRHDDRKRQTGPGDSHYQRRGGEGRRERGERGERGGEIVGDGVGAK